MNVLYIPHQARYQVSMFVDCSFFNQSLSSLKYDIHLKHLKTESEEHFIELRKTNTVLNDEDVHDAFNDMLIQSAEALDTIIVRMNNKGQLTGLANHDEIKKKWFSVRNKIESMYQGHTVMHYLNEMQSKLETSETTWQALSRSFFYTVFFNGIYTNYGGNKIIQEKTNMYDLLPNQEIMFQVDNKISLETETGFYIVRVTGEKQAGKLSQATKHFFENHIQSEILPDCCSMETSGFYKINPSNGSIVGITMEANVAIADIYQKKMQMDVIQLPD